MSFDELVNQPAYGSGAATAYSESTKMCRTPTIQERLDLAVQQAEERLASAKEARDIFARNPDIEKLLNIMQRGSF
jgi:hypothetical protein